MVGEVIIDRFASYRQRLKSNLPPKFCTPEILKFGDIKSQKSLKYQVFSIKLMLSTTTPRPAHRRSSLGRNSGRARSNLPLHLPDMFLFMPLLLPPCCSPVLLSVLSHGLQTSSRVCTTPSARETVRCHCCRSSLPSCWRCTCCYTHTHTQAQTHTPVHTRLCGWGTSCKLTCRQQQKLKALRPAHSILQQ